MDTIPSPEREPQTTPGVNVTVTVSHAPPNDHSRALPRAVGYTVTGLLVIGFIIGQLLVGGAITFTIP